MVKYSDRVRIDRMRQALDDVREALNDPERIRRGDVVIRIGNGLQRRPREQGVVTNEPAREGVVIYAPGGALNPRKPRHFWASGREMTKDEAAGLVGEPRPYGEGFVVVNPHMVEVVAPGRVEMGDEGLSFSVTRA